MDNRLLTLFFASQLGADRRPRTEDELTRFVNDLLHADWEDDSAAIRLKRDLTPDQVAGAMFCDQTRIFIRTLTEDKGAPLTPSGNLNRASIIRLVERMAWPRRTVEYARRVFNSRKFDELDVNPLHIIRVVAECADLAVVERGRLLAKKKTFELCDDARAGALFRHLFVSFFRRFNINYLHGSAETPVIQDTIPIILWRLSVIANNWIAIGKLPGDVYHPVVRAQILSVDPMEGVEVAMLVYKVLKPLCWFGLLEFDPPDDDHDWRHADRKCRKTPLFDRFLSFVFKP